MGMLVKFIRKWCGGLLIGYVFVIGTADFKCACIVIVKYRFAGKVKHSHENVKYHIVLKICSLHVDRHPQGVWEPKGKRWMIFSHFRQFFVHVCPFFVHFCPFSTCCGVHSIQTCQSCQKELGARSFKQERLFNTIWHVHEKCTYVK